jgi:hypothetical protein
MTKQELRIGNIVTDEFYESFKKIITVESINDKGINLEVQNSDDYPEMQTHWIEPYYTFEQLRGIELSEERLNRAGQKENNIFWTNFSQDNSGYFIWVGGFKCYLRYVHNWQNCFYALTGTELTID